MDDMPLLISSRAIKGWRGVGERNEMRRKKHATAMRGGGSAGELL